MDKATFAAIRFKDQLVRDRVLTAKKRLVAPCSNCNGSGFYDNDGTLSYCRCMKRFNIVKNIIVSGAPIEALEMYDTMKKKRGGLVDVDYKEVILHINEHDIYESTRRKKLYESLLNPYVSNSSEALGRGDSVLMFGTNSRGKTWSLYYLVIKLSEEYSVLFMPLKDLFMYINSAYYGSDSNRESALAKQNAIEVLTLIRDVDLLLLDEGSKLPKFSDSVSVQLEGIVKERIGNGRSVVMTTNHAPLEFHKTFGSQVVSAFIKNVYCVHILNGPDLRHKAMKTSKAFGYIKK